MLISIFLGTLLFTVAHFLPSYKNRILNGNNVPDPCCPGRTWGRVGHSGQHSTALNNFGRVSFLSFQISKIFHFNHYYIFSTVSLLTVLFFNFLIYLLDCLLTSEKWFFQKTVKIKTIIFIIITTKTITIIIFSIIYLFYYRVLFC